MVVDITNPLNPMVSFAWRGNDGCVFSAAIHPDGKRVATAGHNSGQVWDATSGATLFKYDGCFLSQFAGELLVTDQLRDSDTPNFLLTFFTIWQTLRRRATVPSSGLLQRSRLWGRWKIWPSCSAIPS